VSGPVTPGGGASTVPYGILGNTLSSEVAAL